MRPQSELHSATSSPLSTPIFQQETQPLPIVPSVFAPLPGPLIEEKPLPLIRLHPLSRKRLTRIVVVMLTLLLVGAIFVIWPPPVEPLPFQT
jgi:hypothetical protein